MTPLELPEAFTDALDEIAAADVVRRIWEQDHTVWASGPREVTEPNRLGWLSVVEKMKGEVGQLQDFARQARADGLTRAVLMGMGGSSLAPELFARIFGPQANGLQLEILDTTDPAAIHELTERIDPRSTLFVVSSKSGSTLETLSHYRYFWELIPDGNHFVAITDESTPLASLGMERGFRRVFLNPEDVGGRYSALSFFGLVPAALLGLDLDGLLREAEAMRDACRPQVPLADNPGARLGAFLGKATASGRDKLTLLFPPGQAPLGDWVEQLLAESTGKNGTGILPIVGEPPDLPELYGSDRFFVLLGRSQAEAEALNAAGLPAFSLPEVQPIQLGAAFFLWEFATAIAAYFLRINPFDQPDVQTAKDATNKILTAGAPKIDTHSPDPSQILATASPGDYISILAYLSRSAETEAALQDLRLILARRYRLATTIGFGPRYLHSTGQLHKGGPATGIFLILSDDVERDVAVPGQSFTFGQLRQAQALGDIESLKGRGRRMVHLHLGPEPLAGLRELGQMLA